MPPQTRPTVWPQPKQRFGPNKPESAAVVDFIGDVDESTAEEDLSIGLDPKTGVVDFIGDGETQEGGKETEEPTPAPAQPALAPGPRIPGYEPQPKRANLRQSSELPEDYTPSLSPQEVAAGVARGRFEFLQKQPIPSGIPGDREGFEKMLESLEAAQELQKATGTISEQRELLGEKGVSGTERPAPIIDFISPVSPEIIEKMEQATKTKDVGQGLQATAGAVLSAGAEIGIPYLAGRVLKGVAKDAAQTGLEKINRATGGRYTQEAIDSLYKESPEETVRWLKKEGLGQRETSDLVGDQYKISYDPGVEADRRAEVARVFSQTHAHDVKGAFDALTRPKPSVPPGGRITQREYLDWEKALARSEKFKTDLEENTRLLESIEGQKELKEGLDEVADLSYKKDSSSLSETWLQIKDDIRAKEIGKDPEARYSLYSVLSASLQAGGQKLAQMLMSPAAIERGWTGRSIMSDLLSKYRYSVEHEDSLRRFASATNHMTDKANRYGLAISHEMSKSDGELFKMLVRGEVTDESINNLIKDAAHKLGVKSDAPGIVKRLTTARFVKRNQRNEVVVDLARDFISDVIDVGHKATLLPTRTTSGKSVKMLLNRDTWEANFGTYLRREWEKDLLKEAEDFRASAQELKARPISKTSFMKRTVSEEVVKENPEGLIEDPAYLVRETLAKAVRGVELTRHYQALEKMGLVSNKHPGLPGWKRVVVGPSVVKGEEGSTIVFSGKWGPLTNKWVAPEVIDDIRLVDEWENELDTTFKKINSFLKKTHTVYNIPTVFANILGNVMTADVGGFSAFIQPIWLIKGASVLSRKEDSPLYIKMRDLGVIKSNFVTAELSKESLFFPKTNSKPSWYAAMLEPILYRANKTGLTPTQIYGFLEDLWKSSMWMYRREKHLASGQLEAAAESAATNDVNRALFDYSDVSRAVRSIRSNPITGSPFITYYSKALPFLAKEATTVGPGAVRYWKWPLMLNAYERLFSAAYGEDEEERDLRKKSQAPWRRSYGASDYLFGPMSIPFPLFNKPDGRVIEVSLDSIHPLSGIAHAMTEALYETPEAKTAPYDVFMGMLLRPWAEIAFNTRTMDGKPVFGRAGKVEDVANHLWRSIAPTSPLPTSGFFPAEIGLAGIRKLFPEAPVPSGLGAESIEKTAGGASSYSNYSKSLSLDAARLVVGGRFLDRDVEADARMMLVTLARINREIQKEIRSAGAAVGKKMTPLEAAGRINHLRSESEKNAQTFEALSKQLESVEGKRRRRGIAEPPELEAAVGEEREELSGLIEETD